MPTTAPARLQLRIDFGDGARLGPGKVDLLQHIHDTGSISAAGRLMQMSYRRAWQLVEALNHDFGDPLVQTLTGGKGGGGARLTERGQRVLRAYRHMQDACAAAAAVDIAALRRCRSNA